MLLSQAKMFECENMLNFHFYDRVLGELKVLFNLKDRVTLNCTGGFNHICIFQSPGGNVKKCLLNCKFGLDILSFHTEEITRKVKKEKRRKCWRLNLL
jgi:hypothetical protein